MTRPTRAKHETPRLRVLLVDDNEDNLLLLSETLDDEGYELELATGGLDALAKARRAPPDLVLLDLRMPGIDGHETCRRLKADAALRDAPVLFLSATDSLDDRLEGFAAGAVDFIAKPFDPDEIVARVRTHLEIARLTRELSARNAELEREITAARAFRREQLAAMLAPLRGDGPVAQRLREEIEAAAASDAPVLLRGALVDGTEAVARAIHEASARGWRPFVRVQRRVSLAGAALGGTLPTLDNAPSLDDHLRLADDGTIYVEGVDLLGEDERAPLLAQLDGGEVRITAQCEDLDGEGLGDGWSIIDVPPLSARGEDLEAIVSWLLEAEFGKLGEAAAALGEGELERLRLYPWPGGIAELESVIRRAVLRSDGGPLTFAFDLAREARHLGRYALQRRLGKGGMGEVWEARHDLLPHPVAIKIIAPGLSGAKLERAKRRFAREAVAIARLRSPYTVRIFDFGSSDAGELYYAMELLDGLDLHTLVRNDGPLSPARTIYLMRQVASSLVEAHAHGLVHRDIKPPNLIVAQLGAEPDWIKVVDFGVVTVEGGLDSDGGGGTPGFVAPELITQTAGPTAASDIYSLGCTIYWCLCGDEPFSTFSTESLLNAHAHEQPTALSVRTDLPEELDELVLTCLAKQPEDRPTAVELVDSLERLGQRYPWTREQAWRWWAKRAVLDIDELLDTV